MSNSDKNTEKKVDKNTHGKKCSYLYKYDYSKLSKWESL